MTSKTRFTTALFGMLAVVAIGARIMLTGDPEPDPALYVDRETYDELEGRNRKLSKLTRESKVQLKELSERNRALEAQAALLTAELEGQSALDEARETEQLAAEASTIPVAFGEWADLEAIKNANWSELGGTVGIMNALILELYESIEKGETPDADLQDRIRAENNKLVRYAAEIMGKIPTNSPINGEFSHPITLANLMGGMLEQGDLPLTAEQRSAMAELGNEYEASYGELDAAYTESTPRLEKLVDELELKRDTMRSMESVLTDEQRESVIQPAIHDRLQLDPLSPATMATMLARPRNVGSLKEQLVTGIAGLIPSHGRMNGEYTHPLVLTNLMASALDVAGQPFTSRRKALIAEAGEGFERAFDRRQAIYTGETSALEKLTDELELKRDCMKRVKEVLTPEQRDVIVLPEIQDRLRFDILSPANMVAILVKPTNARSKGQVRSRYPSLLAQGYELASSKLEAQTELFDAWFEEIAPLLETVADKTESLHLDQVITAERAQAHLIKGLLGLDDLSANSRDAMRIDPTWLVPTVTYKPIDAVRKSVSELRDCCAGEERLADELFALGTLLGDRNETIEAIALLIEASEIYEKVLGDGWNPDPLRHGLRDVVRPIAMDRDQGKETYEAALRGARVVLALKPTSAYSMNVVGVIEYQLGLHEAALATLSRSEELRAGRYEDGNPVDLAFIAMANLRLERNEEARAALARLRKVMESREQADSTENRKVLAESEALFETTASSPQ